MVCRKKNYGHGAHRAPRPSFRGWFGTTCAAQADRESKARAAIRPWVCNKRVQACATGNASLDSQRAEVTNDLGFRGFFGLLDVHPEALGPVPDPLARQVRSQTSPDPGPGHPICTRWYRRRKGVRHSTSAMGRRAKHTFTSLPPSPSQVSLPPSLPAEGDDATPGRKMAARRCVCYNTHSLCTCGRILRRDAQDKQTY
jgi:hypothetical protein